MAVTREQIAQWSKNFEAKNPGTGTAQSTTTQGTTKKKESVSREQISQWSQNFEQQEKQKEQQEAGEQLNKVTSGLAAGGQMAQQNPAVKYNPVKLKQVKPPENTTDTKARAVTQSRNQQWDRERHASDIGEVDARRDEMSTQLSNDVYAQVNNWKDASTRNRELYDLVDKGEPVQISEDAIDMRKVSDYELRQRGYRPDEIRQAHAYADAYGKLNSAGVAARRLEDTVLSWTDSIGGSAVMTAGALPQAVGTEVKDDDEIRTLMRAIQRVDGTNGMYTDKDLIKAGWTREQINEARARLDAGEASAVVDNPVYNWGKEVHEQGQRRLADAMAGETEAQRFWHGAASSAGENLALAAANPALILPVLSLQGAGDSLAQSGDRGDTPETAMLKGIAKFGAGWAINSVGAADLAKTMGSDYAKDTLAGQIADWVKGMAGSSDFAQAHPAVANAISGGMDNAMQAFVETYADKAIDAALGDSEAAESLFDRDTFVAALESGLSGGASGAMGGAVGTGLRGMSEAIDRAAKTPSVSHSLDSSLKEGALDMAGKSEPDAESPAERESSQSVLRTDSDELRLPASASASTSRLADRGPNSSSLNPPQAAVGAVAPEGRALAEAERVEETAVNDDPAVHTAQQNASIAEYKESVDPKMAEYVDKVRAGEKLAPYTVAKTSDRTRSAMMELTGLAKVGDVTMLDANGVNHITNRHGGGDGSADGTMKESADVARAAYVLNNFDNAYLAKDKAKGYKDSRGKRAPIVIFEKKIDGSHIVVEAACDTKKGQNFIVTEYLSSVGVDQNEVVKALQAPMDAASDPRHTSETFSAHSSTTAEELQASMDATSDPRDTSETLAELPSAKTSIADESGSVNNSSSLAALDSPLKEGALGRPGNSALNEESTTGRKAAGPATEARNYEDETLTADEGALDTSGWANPEQKAAAAKLARAGQVSTQGVQTMVDNMPGGIGAQVYTQAAKAVYRAGVYNVESFEKALNATGPEGTMGGAVRQVMALGRQGENALKLAYLQGKGEAEAYSARKAGEIGSGKGFVRADAGTVYNGEKTLNKGTDPDSALLDLTAKSTGTVVHRMMEGLANNAKGCIRAAAGEMYFAGDAGSETVMHETFHALNEWSGETGQAVMDKLLESLVERNGAESTEKLLQSYLDKYAEAGVKLTYNQALEEVTADAMETVFGTEESFRDFVRQQAAEARMNADAKGTIDKVMEKIQNFLESVLKDLKRFLKAEPTNAAAKAAKNLTEQQLADLRALYFEHQIAAGEKLREAMAAEKENKNAAPSGKEDTAVKFQLHEGKDSLVKQMNQNIERLKEMKTVAVIKGTEVAFGANRRENITNVTEYFDSIGNQAERKGFGTVELTAKSARTTVQHGNSAAKQAAVAAVPEIIKSGEQIGYEKNWQDRGYDTYVFAAPVEINGVKLYEGAVVNSYLHNGQKVFYVHEICWTDGSHVTLDNRGIPTKKEDISTSLPKAMLNALADGQKISSIDTIAQTTGESKADTKYQLEVDSDAADEARESGLGDVEKQTETIRQAVEAGGNARVSEESLADIARAVRADHGSKVSTKWLTERLGALSDYLSESKAVDWADANAFVMDMAEQIMQKSSKKNDELWKAYPELHQMSLQIQKGSSDQQELVYRYGSMANARREAARHGVKLTYTKDGAVSRWDGDYGELKKLGAGLFPNEAPASAAEALEAMMSAHDAIKPTLENAYDEDWDGAKQDIAMQIWQRYMNAPEMANEANAGMRKDFADQWKKVRQQARQEATDARAKAVLAMSEKRLKDAQWASRELAKRTAMEKARRDAQVDRIRDMREMDNTRRSIRRLTTQLNGMVENKKGGSSVPGSIAKQVLAVAQIANDSTRNTVMLGRMRKLGSMISTSAGDGSDRAGIEWENSNLNEKIANWLDSVDESREMALAQVQKDVQRANKRLDALFAAETKAGQELGSRYGKEEADLKAYLSHLKMRQKEYEDGGMARMTADQLRGLRQILEETVHIIRNENKLLGEEEKADIDEFAKGADAELRAAKGIDFGDGLKGRLSQMTASYRMNSLNIERQFERMGGYVHGGYMERIGRMLNEGQYKKTSLIVEGTAIFEDVTGKGNLAKMDRFEHELIDIGLRADDGRPWPITRAMAAALYIQAQNQQGLHHMTHGGLKIPNMEYWVKGDKARAEHDTQTIRVGDLKFDGEGYMLNQNGDIATEVEQMKLLGTQKGNLLTELSRWINADDEMGEYTRKVLDDYRKFDEFTKKNVNETSMVLSGNKRAIVENYIPQRVDEDTRAVENEAIRYDNSIGNEGFLQPRKNSGKPIYLDDIFSVVNRSLENVAQYAGMAIPLRNVSKLMSTQTNGKNLNAAIRDTWGRQGAQYMEKAIGDLYPQRNRAEVGDKMAGVLRGAAAGAVLTFNLNVTLMQAASLPTAAAELGWGSTGHAAVQFGKNLDPVNKLMSAVGLTENRLKAVEAEIAQHGDALLQYRLRGTKSGELSTAAEAKSRLAKAGDAIAESKNPLVSGAAGVYDVLKNSIAKMDEVTVAALWEGAKDYVVKNPGEFDAQAQEKGSPAYWAAVNRAYQRAVERTQPNYTAMQRTGFQRSSNQLMKFLMMYSTQRQQNMQIVTAAFEDLAAQKARYKAEKTEGNKMAVKTAGARAARAVSSQVTAAAVISLMSMAVKFALHRRKDFQDENGDMSLTKSVQTFLAGMVESLASNPVGGSEVYSTISSIREGNDYDAVSVNGISSINDLVANISTFYKEVGKDTEGMDEEDYEKHVERVKKDLSNIAGSASQLLNVPYSNLKKYVDAVCLYIDDFKNGTLTDFNSLPASATGQYDRLYNAVQSGDSEEAAAALGKLEKMGKADQVNSQLSRRLKAYDEDLLTAAKARNAGKAKEDEAARRALLDRLCRVMGDDRRTELISVVNRAVNDKADELLKAEMGLDKDANVYAGLTEELETGRTKDVQAEIDRLLRAGKEKGQIKTAITGAVKNEYLAGSDGDRERLEKKLLDLEDAEGEPLYEEKNFTKWVNDAEKEAEEKKNEKNWWD